MRMKRIFCKKSTDRPDFKKVINLTGQGLIVTEQDLEIFADFSFKSSIMILCQDIFVQNTV